MMIAETIESEGLRGLRSPVVEEAVGNRWVPWAQLVPEAVPCLIPLCNPLGKLPCLRGAT